MANGAPDWMNEPYFEILLKEHRNDNSIKVNSIKTSHAIPKGENFVSTLYRVRVNFKVAGEIDELSESYIVKCQSSNESAEEKLREYDVHNKEMDVYGSVIPELRKLMSDCGDCSKVYPVTLKVDRERNVIIFEDLATQGYVMTDRLLGLDETHLKMALKVTAKFHAGSLKLAESDPSLFERYRIGMMTRDTDAFHQFFQFTFEAWADEISNWGPEWQYYADKVRNLLPIYMEQGIRVFDHQDNDDLRVLNHGDLWTNNFMFKYDNDGKLEDVVLLDFQFCCYATPAVDLFYLFYTSAQEDIRLKRFDEIMQYYYDHLVTFSQQLDYQRQLPTLHQFQQQLLKKMFYAVHTSFVAFPIQINEDVTDADFDAFVGNDERSWRYRKTIMANKKFHRIVKQLLPVFDQKGLLEKLE